MADQPRIIHLTAGGVSFAMLVDAHGPRVLHWGAALSEADVVALAASDLPAVTFSSFDAPRSVTLLPVDGDGWSGTPGLAWHRAGADSDVRLVTRDVTMSTPADGGASATVALVDEAAAVTVELVLTLDSFGVLESVTRVTNVGETAPPLDLLAARLVLPLPTRATEIVDLTGRWTRERSPQRTPVRDGAHVRQGRRGRPGHDAPLVTMVGTSGFAFRSGEVWGVHVAWSGNHEVSVERLPEGAGVHAAVIAAGELLNPGEIRLAAGETYASPATVWGWSDAGIDGLSRALHGHVRARDAHPRTSRPLTLNTWEAVYFDHDPAALSRLARLAHRVGVERFVLDDGWFAGRPNDRSGLGDWVVDAQKWPRGVQELSALVHELGMEFGLWFEPEMVNQDSDLARRHPEWILGVRKDPAEWRHQLVLDLTRAEVRAHLLERIDSAIREVGVDFIKWDHNRDLHGAVSPASGRAAVHAQTEATYALMDEVRRRHPRLEIESCASGGARVDLGILSRSERVWASDTNDPIERQGIQRWTGVLLPPELVGSHVGPETAHTTHRASTLGFRLLTALFMHAGIEWDLTTCTEAELDALTRWTALYRELRPLLHTGTTVRADLADESALLHGVVANDASHAVFAWIRVATSGQASTPRVPLPGLDPDATYRVRVREDLGRASRHEVADPVWIAGSPVLSGRALATAGLPLPLLDPGHGLLLEVTRVAHSAAVVASASS